MKKFKIIFGSLFIFLATSLTMFGQKTCNHTASCKTALVTKDNSKVTYIGNVRFDSAKLIIQGADTVYFNNITNKMIAINAKKYTFDGEVVAENKLNEYARIEYTIGDTKLYIK